MKRNSRRRPLNAIANELTEAIRPGRLKLMAISVLKILIRLILKRREHFSAGKPRQIINLTYPA